MDETGRNQDGQMKKGWIKPELETLDINKTEYWEYRWNQDTGFFEEVWVNES